MKKYQFLIATIVFVSTFIWACNESFLEFDPNTGEVTDADFFKDKDDFESYLFGGYTTLQGLNGTEPGNFVLTPGYLTQDLVQVDETNLTIDAVLQPGSGDVLGLWTRMYTIVTQMNTLIGELENLEAGTLSENDANILKGEALFLRGFAYYKLASTYGNVPLFTEPYNVELNNLGCSSREEVFAQAIADLTFSSTNLPDPGGWGDANLGRATKGSALAFIVKANMYLQNWVAAETAANSLIAFGYYQLEPDLRQLFCVNCPDGPETIFAVQYRQVNDGNFNWAGPNNQGNLLNQWSAPRGIDPAFATAGGWGGTIVKGSVADEFESNDFRRTELLKVPGETYQGSLMETPYTIPEDIGQPNSAFSTKWWHGPESSWLIGQNLNLIRYGEFLLNYAEVLFEAGKTGEAYDALNQVRSRSGLPNKAATADREQFLDDLMYELRVELLYEGDFWSHLVRTGYASKFLSEKHGVIYDSKWEFWPIPQREIDQNPNLCQNPGY